MLRFAANLTLLWPELPLFDRFAAARAAGFAGVELLFPYDLPARVILERLEALRLPLVLINCPPPNHAGGARGFAAVPGGEARFRSDLRRAARHAAALGCPRLHVMAGAAEGEAARATFVANLAWAAAAAPGLALTIEPLNREDVPGYFLADFGLACAVLDEVGAPNLGLQFDSWHALRLEGCAHRVWDRVGPRVTHVQIAGRDGRREPDDPAFLDRLDAEGYAGWVAAEYRPRGRTEDGLGWLRAATAPRPGPPPSPPPGPPG
jgi:hydroxypyruvate isomerase